MIVDMISGFGGTLLKHYNNGGAVMHAISILSVASMTTIIYKIIAFKKIKMKLSDFISQIRAALLKGNVKGAVEICESFRGPVAAITKSALLKYGSPREQVEKSMENAAIHEVAYLEKFLPVLATITNIAPLLGFLGTVVGMINAFDVIAEQGLNNPGLVAHGISIALLTTAYGLIVAFFTQPFYTYFMSLVAHHTREIETSANILFETFDEMDRMSGKAD
jgi:biopolymer transport protein ExbB